MKNKVRVRFAPSPTGPLHIGGVRTALYNYLFAKKHGGDFILRIEDTDQNRYVEGAENYIADSLSWLGIPPDEAPQIGGDHGPYRQSERVDFYKTHIDQLLSSGWAYYAFDSEAELASLRSECEAAGETFIYNWRNRDGLNNSLTLSESETSRRIAANDPYVIRFRWPLDTFVRFDDLIRGSIQIDGNTLDDKVLFKSDGMPTYHLANIVDDHLMGITHVIRGEEWLPSLALHCQLYKAFGWEAPEFAHLPLIMKPAGKGKLSKRDGEKLGFPVFPLQWKESKGYRESGYFPEAVLNFLALLGWNPGTDQELFQLQELVDAFELDRVQKSGARFDPEKNIWFNHQHLQLKPVSELVALFRPVLSEKGLDASQYSEAHLESVISLIKERASFVREFWDLGAYFFVAPKEFEAKAVRKQWKSGTPDIMRALYDVLKSTDPFGAEHSEKNIKAWIAENSLGFGMVMPPLRLALVGALKGPQIFDIMELIGKDETLARIEFAIDHLEAGV
ncbi:glutamate--tRNA ligase [Robiginitalea aurantiaca]|uniref:Glutamate--tRNA ligase n=1 Tax=Robiginitalea aurantiaca TaxID=3056915 RepID=A0ABT7WAE8_9FLAO|nr:glutamate--tRNA ligase [Robiginitalea aurantiaca]MDM9629873.1 glutamate--tRNA ligase [Robiginitalea aurantiaca]